MVPSVTRSKLAKVSQNGQQRGCRTAAARGCSSFLPHPDGPDPDTLLAGLWFARAMTQANTAALVSRPMAGLVCHGLLQRLVDKWGPEVEQVLDSPSAVEMLVKCDKIGAKTAEKIKAGWDMSRGGLPEGLQAAQAALQAVQAVTYTSCTSGSFSQGGRADYDDYGGQVLAVTSRWFPWMGGWNGD